MRLYTCLHDLTGHESGAVYYHDHDSQELWIGNWSRVSGLPRVLAPLGTLGLGETLRARRCATPLVVRRAMWEHEQHQGAPRSRAGWRAWRVTGGDVVATVVVNQGWD